jgi:hypothetical protein
MRTYRRAIAAGRLACAGMVVSCSGWFGDLAPQADERCYPSCAEPDTLGFLARKEMAKMPESVTVQVCRGQICDAEVELPVRDAGGELEARDAGAYRYWAYHGGEWPPGTLVAQVQCVRCRAFTAGEQVDISVAVDGSRAFAVRATVKAVTFESPRTPLTLERDCPDVARRTCQELRPTYQELD